MMNERNAPFENGAVAPPDAAYDLDGLQDWWQAYGPGTPAGEAAHASNPAVIQAAWDGIKAKLLASGMLPYELESSFDAKSYTVVRQSARIPVEQAYPEFVDDMTRLFKRFPDIQARRRGL